MANVGLSYPVVGKYTNTSGTISYSDYTVIGKAVSLELSLDSGSDNNLYADNIIVESDNQFGGGEITITTDNLDASVMKTLLGLVEENLGTIAGLTTVGAKVLKYNNAQNIPHFGFGAIRKVIKNGVTKYQALMFNNVVFKNPNESLETQGDTITWGTPDISATVMRDESATNEWRRITSDLDTEADAKLVLQSWLGYVAPNQTE